MQSEETIIKILNLNKSFDGKSVLKGIDLDIEKGSITFIIGPSGCGKSVLIKHIIGLLKPDSGSIIVEGTDIVGLSDREMNEVRKSFGMLFQHSALFDSMTVLENVAFPLVEHTKKPWSQIKKFVKERLEMLGLFNVEDKYPAELSGGMRKRVGLARATILNPKIIIYDEPTTGLDPIMCENVDDMITDAQKNFDVTSIVISHDMASTFRIANKVAMLYDGSIVEVGTPEKVKMSNIEVVRKFIYLSGTGPLQL